MMILGCLDLFCGKVKLVQVFLYEKVKTMCVVVFSQKLLQPVTLKPLQIIKSYYENIFNVKKTVSICNKASLTEHD